MKRLQTPQKHVHGKFTCKHVHEIAAVNLQKNLLPEKRKENI